jgi:L-malate glycosyltransferase
MNGLSVAIITYNEERAAIEARIQERGLEGKVVLTGFRSDVPPLLAELDLFLITSETEGLGTSILDAFASGVPVVATAAGGIPEIVLDGESGLLAPVRDAAALARCVRSVLDDRALSARLLEGGARRLGEHTVERMAERTLEVYGEAVSEHRLAAAR